MLERLTSVQMNGIDTNLANALDMLNGGSYEIQAPVEIASAGLGVYFEWTCPVSFTSLFAASGPAQFTHSITNTGNMNLGTSSANLFNVVSTVNFAAPVLFWNTAPVTIDNNLTVNGTATIETISGLETIGGTVVATGAWTFSNTVGMSGNLTVGGNTTLGNASGDTVTVNAGTVTLGTGPTNTVNVPARMNPSLPIRIRGNHHEYVVAANANKTYYATGFSPGGTESPGNEVDSQGFIVALNFTSARKFNLSVFNDPSGEDLWIFNASGQTIDIHINDPNFAGAAAFTLTNGQKGMFFCFNNGGGASWYRLV